jgi:hypothetical protein
MFYRDQQRRNKCRPKKIKIIEDVNDDELVLSSSGVVLEVNERGGGGGTFTKL